MKQKTDKQKKINKAKNWFFKKTDKIDKHLEILNKILEKTKQK